VNTPEQHALRARAAKVGRRVLGAATPRFLCLFWDQWLDRQAQEIAFRDAVLARENAKQQVSP